MSRSFQQGTARVLAALILFTAMMPTSEATSYQVHKALWDVRYLAAATTLLQADIGRLPRRDEWPTLLVKRSDSVAGLRGPYVASLRIDPWGRHYVFAVQPRAPGGFHIYSFGVNGMDDRGINDDVSSWHGFDEAVYFPHATRDRVLWIAAPVLILGALAYGLGKLIRLFRRAVSRKRPVA